MLAQLVYRKRTPSHATASLYRSKAFEEGKASAKGFQDAVRAEVNRFSRVFFVIDGVDQPSDKDRILNRLQKLPEHTQILFTMREERTSSKEDHLSILASRNDLESYVGSRVEQDEGLCALLKQYPSELKTAIVQQVAQKSHGLYVLKHLSLFSQ
jgi:predicted transcriptional regulator